MRDPGLFLFHDWVWKTQPATASVWPVAVLVYVGVIFTGWLLLKYYDEPLREHLTRKLSAASQESTSSARNVASNPVA